MKITMTFEVPEILIDNKERFKSDLTEIPLLLDTDEKYNLFVNVMKEYNKQLARDRDTLNNKLVNLNNSFKL